MAALFTASSSWPARLRGLRRWIAPKPGSGQRPARKPASLEYGLEDAVPPRALIPLAAQHAMLALTFLIYPLIAAAEAGLGEDQTAAMVGACALCIGLTTMLQSANTRFSSGYLGVHIPSPGAIPLAVQALSLGGPGLLGAATALIGLCQIAAARLVRPLRVILPPEVCGVAVTLLGVSLASPALRRALGLEGDRSMVDLGPFAIAMVTLCLIIAITVFAPRRLKIFALVVGAGLGWLMAELTGHGATDLPAALAAAPLFRLPTAELPPLTMAPSLLPLIALVLMMSLVDVLSTTVSLEKMNDATWRRADMRAAGRAVTATGIGNVLNGLSSGFQSSLSSSAVGLAFATGATARVIGIAAGAMIAVTACFPKAIVVLTSIPSPVIGGILFYASAYLLVAGMELVLSRRLSERRVFVVGLSIIAGLSVALLPLHGQLPLWAQPLFSTPLTLGACCAILLNLLFRIGVSREGGEVVPAGSVAFDAAREFLERQGDLWGARREVIATAIPVAAQALELAEEVGAADSHAELRARFDETHLDVMILYDGPVLVAPKRLPSAESLLDEDATAGSFGAYMLSRLGDHVTFGQSAGRGRIMLRFDH